jgi:DNA-binding MarR family transcriptional regulator
MHLTFRHRNPAADIRSRQSGSTIVKESAIAGQSALPRFDCACATVRRTARLITQLYDAELRPHLQASQFALLSVLARRPGCNQSMLAAAAAFDKTTLSRNLGLMARNGWIERSASVDPRERGFRLSPAGRRLLRAAKPGWSRAQKQLRSAMNEEEWANMWRILDMLTNAARRARKENEKKS